MNVESRRRAPFVVTALLAALAAVFTFATSTADAPGSSKPPPVVSADGKIVFLEHNPLVDSCSLEAAVRSIGRVFRGLSRSSSQEILSGFVERKPIPRYAWGFSLERPEEGPHGLNEDSTSSRLIGTTVPRIERLVTVRSRQHESFELVALVLDLTPTRQRVPLTVYYLRHANDVIGYGWGDGGIAKGQFDCDDGRLVWFAGGHTPNQVPVAAGASGRIVCVRRAQRERLFLPGIGWGCAH
jgi:hypothetical protein